MINKTHGLSPPGGLVSPSGGFSSLLFDQVGHFASIKLCLALSRQGAEIKISVVRCCLYVQDLNILEFVVFELYLMYYSKPLSQATLAASMYFQSVSLVYQLSGQFLIFLVDQKKLSSLRDRTKKFWSVSEFFLVTLSIRG